MRTLIRRAARLLPAVLPVLLVPGLLVPVVLLSACASVDPGTAETDPFEESLTFGGEIVSPSDVFVVMGDSRPAFFGEPGESLDGEEMPVFTRAIAKEAPAFLLHLGDIAKRGSDTDAWEQFDRDFAPMRTAGVPLFPVLGNHDYMGSDSKALANWFSRFTDLGRRNAYARTFRGIRIIVLDSNVDELGEPRAAREVRWLERRLTEAAADDSIRAVFVAAHHPAFSNRMIPGESEWMRDTVFPLLTRFPKVRMLFTGHVHAYEHFEMEGIHCVVTGGGGSPLQWLSDPDAEDARPDLYRGPRNFHYVRIRAGERIVVDVKMLREDGTWFLAEQFVL